MVDVSTNCPWPREVTKYSSRLLVLASINPADSSTPRVSVFTDIVNSMFVGTLSAERMLAGSMLVWEDTVVEHSADGSENCPLLLWKDPPACEMHIVICSNMRPVFSFPRSLGAV
jgi:hypothetical protein